MKIRVLGTLVLALGGALPAAAGKAADAPDLFDSPLTMVAALALLSLAPFLLVVTTSFLKIAVVLGLLRNAIGTPRVPPTMVITGLAVALTVVAMAPTAGAVAGALERGLAGKPATVDSLLEAGSQAREPVREFLLRHAHEDAITVLHGLAVRARKGGEVKRTDLVVAVPAFILSELKEAFLIGFLLFIPFLVLDLVVANVLLALGMHMLAPTTVSLPFKLLLFVAVDGWTLVISGLLEGYIP